MLAIFKLMSKSFLMKYLIYKADDYKSKITYLDRWLML